MNQIEMGEVVESWLNGNLESVANKLLTSALEGKPGDVVDFITLLLKERGVQLNFDSILDLAKLGEMLNA